MRGTTDIKEIAEWLGIINKMYLYAKTPGLNPPKILNAYRVFGKGMLYEVFGLDLGAKLHHEALLPMLERNEEYVMDLCLAVKSWDTFGMAYMETVKYPKTKLGAKETGGLTPEGLAAQYAELANAQPLPWQTTTIELPTIEDEPAEQETNW